MMWIDREIPRKASCQSRRTRRAISEVSGDKNSQLIKIFAERAGISSSILLLIMIFKVRSSVRTCYVLKRFKIKIKLEKILTTSKPPSTLSLNLHNPIIAPAHQTQRRRQTRAKTNRSLTAGHRRLSLFQEQDSSLPTPTPIIQLIRYR